MDPEIRETDGVDTSGFRYAVYLDGEAIALFRDRMDAEEYLEKLQDTVERFWLGGRY